VVSFKKTDLKLKMLVVDENKNFYRPLALNLKNTRCSLVVAQTMPSALSRLEDSGSFDVALIDFKLKNKDDQKLIKNIQKKYPDLLITIMTSYTNLEDAVTFFKDIPFDYLLKPLTKNILFHFLGHTQAFIQLKRNKTRRGTSPNNRHDIAKKSESFFGASRPKSNESAHLPLEEVERRHILEVLSKENNFERVAGILGITKATLWRKRKQYGLI
jgi:DNA-binding NtrC family response regulator